MGIKLPKEAVPKEPRSVRSSQSLQPEDTIEYGLTVEVSLDKGRKAWIKFGTTSAVRADETTEQALTRVTEFVNNGIDDRIDDLS